MKRLIWTGVVLIWLSCLPAQAEIAVTNVAAAQRSGAKLVDISYDLLSDGDGSFDVSLSVSNGAQAVGASTLTGDVGSSISTGASKVIVWDAGADWDGNVAQDVTFTVTAELSSNLVQILAGTNSGSDPDSGAYSLTVNAFYMGTAEITNDEMVQALQWAYGQSKLIVSGSSVSNATGDAQELLDLDDSDCRITWNGSSFEMKSPRGTGYPCVEVSWYGAAAYCNYRSEMEGRTPCYDLSDWSCDVGENGYRLPADEEWEYAARGGLVGERFPWGAEINHSNANYRAIGDGVFSYDISTYDRYTYLPGYDNTSPVGTFPPNGYGLIDMAGNVLEWCNDKTANTYRSVRGGSWGINAYFARCSIVIPYPSDSSFDNLGFRVVR